MPENPLDLPPELLALVEKRMKEDRRRSEEAKQGAGPSAGPPEGIERRQGPRRDEGTDADGDA